MKRLLSVPVVAYLCLFSIEAQAEIKLGPSDPSDGSSLTLSGSARYRAEGDDKTDFVTNRDFSLIRIRADFLWKADPTVDVLFEPQFAKNLGDTAYVGASSTTNTATSTSGNANYDWGLGVHQGYINYHPVSNFAFLAGRQILSYGDELLVGAAEWNNIGRSFDAVRARMNMGSINSDLFASKIVETNAATNSAGDQNFYGWYNTANLGPGFQAVDLYALYLQDSTQAGVPTQNTTAVGTRLKSRIETWDYRLELTKEYGNAVSSGKASQQGNLEVGYVLPFWTGPRLALEGFWAGKTFNQLFPTAHKWLGYADVFGRQNIGGYALHLNTKPSPTLGIQLDFYRFYRTDPSGIPVNTRNQPIFKTNVSNSLDLGSEWDLTFRYQASRSLAFQAGASIVSEGQYLQDQAGDLTPKFYYAQLEVSF